MIHTVCWIVKLIHALLRLLFKYRKVNSDFWVFLAELKWITEQVNQYLLEPVFIAIDWR